jgi:PAS domain S-box-containing protein
MHWRAGFFVLPLLLAAGVSLVSTALLWPRRKTEGVPALMLTLAAAAFWSLIDTVIFGLDDLGARILLANIEYLFITSAPVLWFLFVMQYASQGANVAGWRKAWLFIIPAITVALVWTDQYHGLVRHDFWLDTSGSFYVTRKTYGPWFWVFTAYINVLMVWSAVKLARALYRSPDLYRSQVIVLLVGMALPWIGNYVWLLGQHAWSLLDPTPVAFAVSGTVLAVGLFRFGLFDIVPAARDAVIENMPNGVVVLDTRGRIVDLNPAAAAILRCTTEQLVGCQAAQTPLSLDGLLNGAQESSIKQAELALDDERGQRFYDVQVAPLYGRRGQLAGRLLTLQDITTRKRLEQQLRHIQKLEAIGQLAGGVAHNFNNLLTVINGYSQLILTGLASDDPLREDIGAILSAGNRAAELTRQLLVFSQRDRPRVDVMDLSEVFQGIARVLGVVTGPEVTVDIQLASELGKVRADPTQVEQMVMNLVMNACEAMPHGGQVTIETSNLHITATQSLSHGILDPGEYVALTISDSGVGMTPEVKARLFEPFFTTKQVGRGTGLGLATVYGIVEDMGGSIDVTSEIGQGTVISVYIPRWPDERARDAAPAPVSPASLTRSNYPQGGDRA